MTRRNSRPRVRSEHTGLLPKEARFVERYLIHLNAAQAAREAGYSTRNAGRVGNRLLNRRCVAEAIALRVESRSVRAKINADQVLDRLIREVEADLADIFDPDTNQLLPVDEWPPIWRQGLVTSIETEDVYRADESGERVLVARVRKVRFSDRLKRLEMIGRHVDVSAFRQHVVKDLATVSPAAEFMRQVGGRAITPREH